MIIEDKIAQPDCHTDDLFYILAHRVLPLNQGSVYANLYLGDINAPCFCNYSHPVCAPALAAEFQPIQSALLKEMVNGKNAYETTKFTKCALLRCNKFHLAEAGENWTRDYDLQEMFRSAHIY